MLAGRTAASGQLGHARAVLAQTERLVSERAHNRLNPAEREEFFEQVARLKLTLSDAESEAEYQAAEEQTPSPAPIPVDRERLKAMALSLTSSSTTDNRSEGDDTFENRSGNTPTALNEDPDSDLAKAAPRNDVSLAEADDEEAQAVAAKRSSDPSQLRLPRDTADKLTLQSGAVSGVDGSIRRRKPKLSAPPRNKTPSQSAAKNEAKTAVEEGSGDKTEALNATKATTGQKLPKGWIIDDEGYVVPGPS